ncbi:hypothetical protein HAX54_021518 [Datura stramonium]|uniref:Uncharacterized protein n=1 Tax=Datura stramonium TaxID=4076 RepID=A0ABS8UVD0_DATST|nr:hypothetical protein [Datura stramonium]
MEKQKGEEDDERSTCICLLTLPEGCIADILALTSPPDVQGILILHMVIHQNIGDGHYQSQVSERENLAQLEFIRWLEIWEHNRLGLCLQASYQLMYIYKFEDDYGFDIRHMEDLHDSPYTPPSPHSGYVRMEDVDWPEETDSDDNPSSTRDDGWFELELGEFFTGNEDDCIELRMQDVKTDCRKQGLIVEGIEVRPTIVA